MTTANPVAELDARTHHVPPNTVPQSTIDEIIGQKGAVASMLDNFAYAFHANEALGPSHRQKISDLTADINELMANVAHRERATVQTQRTKADDAQIAAWHADIAAKKAAIARLRDAITAAEDTYYPYFPILERVAKARGKLVPAGKKVSVAKGSTALTHLHNINAVVAEKQEAVKHAYANTSPLLNDMISKSHRDIDTRAGENPPDFKPLSRQRKRAYGDAPATFGSVKWPIDYAAEAKGERGKLDAIGLFWWLHADAIKAKATEEITRLYDPSRAMSSADRDAAIAALNAEILELEYEAGAFAELAAADGVNVTYPPTMNPLAIIGFREV